MKNATCTLQIFTRRGAKIQALLNDIISTDLREWALIPLNFSEILLSVSRKKTFSVISLIKHKEIKNKLSTN